MVGGCSPGVTFTAVNMRDVVAESCQYATATPTLVGETMDSVGVGVWRLVVRGGDGGQTLVDNGRQTGFPTATVPSCLSHGS